MEKFIAITKLVVIACLVIVGILCLSFSPAYGVATNPLRPVTLDSQMNNTPGSRGSTDLDINKPIWNYNDGVDNADVITHEVPPDTVPEPATLLLIGAGLAGLKLLRRRG